jgi:hypothetical protein
MGLAINTTEWVRDKINAGDIDGGMAAAHTCTSIFDPVLCELVYRWFSPPAGAWSLRGLVTADLRLSQTTNFGTSACTAAKTKKPGRLLACAQPHSFLGISKTSAASLLAFSSGPRISRPARVVFRATVTAMT